jgi:hypothetical protein
MLHVILSGAKNLVLRQILHFVQDDSSLPPDALTYGDTLASWTHASLNAACFMLFPPSTK